MDDADMGAPRSAGRRPPAAPTPPAVPSDIYFAGIRRAPAVDNDRRGRLRARVSASASGFPGATSCGAAGR